MGPQSTGGEISIRAGKLFPFLAFISKSSIFTRLNSGTSLDPVLVLFMWASGAEFEQKLVKYEYDPTYSPQLLLSAVGINETNGTSSDSVAAASTAIDNSSVSALPFKKSKPSISEPVGTS